MLSSQLFGPVASDFTAINELIESSLHSRVPLVAEIAAYLVQAGVDGVKVDAQSGIGPYGGTRGGQLGSNRSAAAGKAPVKW
mgnify:CR=1 FL=1